MEKSNLKIIALNCKKLGEMVNNNLKIIRKTPTDYLVPVQIPTFSNSESKSKIMESVRGKDLFILTDIGNYEKTYTMFGEQNRKSYNDNYIELVETIDACAGTPDRIWVIEPLLFGSRQHKREGRESLNCAMWLRHLEFMGVKGIISYDVHDPTVRSALNRTSFDNIYPTNTLIDEFLEKEKLDFNNLLIINPDSGAAKRAEYFGKILDSPVGGFRKTRDTSKVIDGMNRILAHEYVGNVPLKDKNIIVVDDMIASGTSMLDVAKKAKLEGANKVFLFATFGLFSDGEKSILEFNQAYKNHFIDKVYITNLTHVPDYIKNLDWLEVVDCSYNIAKIIDTLNKDETIEPLMNGKEAIKEKVKQKKSKTI